MLTELDGAFLRLFSRYAENSSYSKHDSEYLHILTVVFDNKYLYQEGGDNCLLFKISVFDSWFEDHKDTVKKSYCNYERSTNVALAATKDKYKLRFTFYNRNNTIPLA